MKIQLGIPCVKIALLILFQSIHQAQSVLHAQLESRVKKVLLNVNRVRLDSLVMDASLVMRVNFGRLMMLQTYAKAVPKDYIKMKNLKQAGKVTHAHIIIFLLL